MVDVTIWIEGFFGLDSRSMLWLSSNDSVRFIPAPPSLIDFNQERPRIPNGFRPAHRQHCHNHPQLYTYQEFRLECQNEPYIIAAAIDSDGQVTQEASFTRAVFPRMRPGDKTDMIGHGHLIYGPRNPGEFVAFSVLVVESDHDLEDKFEAACKQANNNDSFKDIVKNAAGGARAALTAVDLALGFVLKVLNKNRDDELFRVGGTLLRDIAPAYSVEEAFERNNEYVELTLRVIPLENAGAAVAP